MKKFAKGCLIAALTMVVLGGVISLAASAVGGKRQFEEMAWNGDLAYSFFDWAERHSYTSSNWDYDYDYDYEYTEPEEDYYEYELNSSQPTFRDSMEQVLNYSSVKDLEMELGGGTFNLQKSEDDTLKVTGENVDIAQAYVEDGVLNVLAYNTRGRKQNMTVTVYLPSQLFFDDADISLGAGELNLADLRTEDLDVAIGAGRISINGLQAQTADISVGAGEANLSSAKIGELYFGVGMGRFIMNGEVMGNMYGSCDMGEVNLLLSGSEKDHNYELDMAMGQIQIDNKSIRGMTNTSEGHIDNGAASTYSLNTSMGTIKLNFTNNN